MQDADKPKAERYPKPFFCNDGTIDLGGVQIDLRHASAAEPDKIVPWFTIPDKNKVVLKDVSFNAFLADSSLGSYINPGFSGAKDARGRLTLTSVECRDVPLDWFTASKKGEGRTRADRRERRFSKSDGRGEFLLAISEMEFQAPLLPVLLKSDKLAGEVKKGHIIIADAVVKSDIPIVDAKGKMLMDWSGSVNLQDRNIIGFNTAIAKELLADLPILRNNEKYLPATLNVPVSGSFDAPKVDLVAAVTKSIVPGLGSGKPEDLLKTGTDLIEQLGGGKKDKDKDKKK